MTSINLADDVSEVLADALEASAPADHMANWPSGTTKWLTGDNTERVVAVAFPQDADFEADGMNVFLGARLLNTVNPGTTATESTYRPAGWTSTLNTLFVGNGSVVVQDANATFILSDDFNGSYQGNDAPLPISTVFSGRYGQGSVYNEAIASAWVGRMEFFSGRFFRRGSVAQVKIGPTFSRAVAANTKTEFRATVVFTGRKKFRRSA